MPDNNQHNALTEAVFYILLSLYTPLHGYGIMQFVQEMSNNRVTLAAGTLYGALNTLTEKGWIKSLDASESTRKKEYQITEVGKQVIQTELERLKELFINGKKIAGSDQF